jgi:hypothetical protein
MSETNEEYMVKRKPSNTNPYKVLTPKITSAGKRITLTVPYNDDKGIRKIGFVALFVDDNGDLQSNIDNHDHKV